MGRLHVAEDEAVKTRVDMLRPEADLHRLDEVRSNRSVHHTVHQDSVGNLSRADPGNMRPHSQQFFAENNPRRMRSQAANLSGHGSGSHSNMNAPLHPGVFNYRPSREDQRSASNQPHMNIG